MNLTEAISRYRQLPTEQDRLHEQISKAIPENCALVTLGPDGKPEYVAIMAGDEIDILTAQVVEA